MPSRRIARLPAWNVARLYTRVASLADSNSTVPPGVSMHVSVIDEIGRAPLAARDSVPHEPLPGGATGREIGRITPAADPHRDISMRAATAVSLLLTLVTVTGCSSAGQSSFTLAPAPSLATAPAWTAKGDSLVQTIYRGTRPLRTGGSGGGLRTAIMTTAIGSVGAIATAAISNKSTARTVGAVAGGLSTVTGVLGIVQALRKSDTSCIVSLDRATAAWDAAPRSDEPAARAAYITLRTAVGAEGASCPKVGAALTASGAGLNGF